MKERASSSGGLRRTRHREGDSDRVPRRSMRWPGDACSRYDCARIPMDLERGRSPKTGSWRGAAATGPASWRPPRRSGDVYALRSLDSTQLRLPSVYDKCSRWAGIGSARDSGNQLVRWPQGGLDEFSSSPRAVSVRLPGSDLVEAWRIWLTFLHQCDLVGEHGLTGWNVERPAVEVVSIGWFDHGELLALSIE